jgi:hypothetical protein
VLAGGIPATQCELVLTREAFQRLNARVACVTATMNLFKNLVTIYVSLSQAQRPESVVRQLINPKGE